MDLEQEKARLIEELGHLLNPVRRFWDDDLDGSEVPYIRAQYQREVETFKARLKPFADYAHETREVRLALNRFENDLFRIMQERGVLKEASRQVYETFADGARDAIRALPSRPLKAVFPEHSSFRFYLWLRATCANAVKRLVIVDAYMSADIFHRYLLNVPAGVPVVLVTIQGRSSEWPGFASVAKLYAQDHPLEIRHDPHLHERYVVQDEMAYSLTASIKDAAGKASCEVAPAADAKYVEGLITAAAVIQL